MIPSNALAFLVFLTALSPGYLYRLIVGRRVVTTARSDFMQIVDHLCVGAVCTVIGVAVISTIGIVLPAVLYGPQELSEPLRLSWRIIPSVLGVFVVAALIAIGWARVVIRLSPDVASTRPVPVWAATFNRYLSVARGSDTSRSALYLVVELTNGAMIGGQLQYADTADTGEGRDITLAAPLASRTSGKETESLPHDFVVLAARDIRAVYGRLITPTPSAAEGQP